jgi:glucuronokinase
VLPDGGGEEALNWEITVLAEEGRKDYERRDFSRWPALMDRNFDLRSRIMTINPSNMEMIRTARRCGASANFAGSGGSLVGIYKDDTMFDCLSQALGRLGAKVIRPQVV